MPDGGSVPIVSQTAIEPMKTALSRMFGARHDDGAHRAAARHRQAEQWQLPVGMDYVGLLLLAKWTRAALAFALRFGFSVEGPLSPSGTFETPTDVRYDFAFGGKAEN